MVIIDHEILLLHIVERFRHILIVVTVDRRSIDGGSNEANKNMGNDGFDFKHVSIE